jgi:hypothetical protein
LPIPRQGLGKLLELNLGKIVLGGDVRLLDDRDFHVNPRL